MTKAMSEYTIITELLTADTIILGYIVDFYQICRLSYDLAKPVCMTCI